MVVYTRFSTVYTTVQMSEVSKKCKNVFERSNLCSPKLDLFDQNTVEQ